MAILSVTAQIVTPEPVPVAFARFIAGELLEFQCDRFIPGSAIAVSLPMQGGSGLVTAPVALLGHIAAIKPGRSVLIVHHQPWRGRLVARFFADGSGTRVTLESSLDQEGVSWLANVRGYGSPPSLRPGSHRIGLLVSKSGPAAVFAQATETMATLAIEEINSDGGILGTTAELLVGDDASDSMAGTTAALRLIRGGCRAIFACVTSATFNAVAAAIRRTDTILIHTVLNEGGLSSPGVVRLGERPAEQLRAAVPALMKETSAQRWFLVGHQYCWSYGAHWSARRVIAENGGSVAGENYHPMGTTDFSATLEAIEHSGAELILSSLVGSDEVAFERQCALNGLRSSTRTLALVLDEATQQLIGATDADGVWSAFGYFEGLLDTHRELESRYRAAVTRHAPPLSSLTETTYEAIIAYTRAVAAAADDGKKAVHLKLLEHAESQRCGRVPVRRPILLTESRGGRPHPR
ncbi:ABC transporter substrate-binding protein [Mycobacterium kyogaense]|uniref:ABC transporter substrate-binding protein n=1 Tax=Mycobacterium kyogaense TaxID=2212479 RepID=UPI000DADC857|nr:ABC transporter substrate-binding protein [Mycobacterium kyogaense]